MGTHVGEEQWERMLRRGRLKCVLSDGLLVGFQRSDTERRTSKRRRWSLRIEVAAGRQDRQELELIGMTSKSHGLECKINSKFLASSQAVSGCVCVCT